MSDLLASFEIFLILSLENGKWVRVGQASRSREVQKSWLRFVKNARLSQRVKIKKVVLPITAPGKTTLKAQQMMSDLYNIDVDAV